MDGSIKNSLGGNMEGVSAEVLEKLEELAEEWKPRTENSKRGSRV